MQNYQMKLNFGEDEMCHQMYEYWLEFLKKEDSPTNWEDFKSRYNALMGNHDT